MGQYRQWLQYREVDQKLRAQLARREQEFVQIQTDLAKLDDASSYADNKIIQALLSQRAEKLLAAAIATTYKAQSQLPVATIAPKVSSLDSQIPLPVFPITHAQPATTSMLISEAQPLSLDTVGKEPTGTMSTTLFARSNLPNFGVEEMQEPIINASTQDPLPPLTNPTELLLPTDINALVDNPDRQDQQIPWWLRNAINVVEQRTLNTTSPIDRQSQRTNRLVERWFERWGQQASSPNETDHNGIQRGKRL